MAKLSREDILNLAKLARLHLSEQEVEQFQTEITNILQYVEQLGSVDLDKFEPASQVTGLTNVMRPDVIKDYGVSSEELLKNAPDTQDNQIKVRRVL